MVCNRRLQQVDGLVDQNFDAFDAVLRLMRRSSFTGASGMVTFREDHAGERDYEYIDVVGVLAIYEATIN